MPVNCNFLTEEVYLNLRNVPEICLMERRNFVKKIAGGFTTSLLTLNSSDFLQHNKEKGSADLSEADYWKNIRKKFPLKNHRFFFNNGTSGPVSYQVLDAIQNMMKDFSETGEYGSTAAAREKIAQFINVKLSEISLTHNTTEGINIVAWGLPLKKGDEVIITKQEHVGNALPWLNRAKLDGIILKPFEPASTAQENIDLINQYITSRTKVIALPHITCTTGQVLPIKEISAIAQSKNIFTAIDGAQGAGSMDLDLKTLGCDFYSSSFHKWMLGPAGTGFLFVSEHLMDVLQAKWVGAHSDTGWDLQSDPPYLDGYVPTAHRYDYGSQSAALFSGVEAAIDLMQSIGMDKVEARVRELSGYLQQQLLELNDKVEMLTPLEAASRISMISFRPRKMDFLEFNKIAAQNGFRVRVVPESNQNCIRISTHIYNSFEEIDSFVKFTQEVL
ncbi:cysteine desulfurase SufS [soil metagenome]